MKKKLAGKLSLNKNTISNLSQGEMQDIRGASVIFACSESCSIIIVCCDTTEPIKVQENLELDRD